MLLLDLALEEFAFKKIDDMCVQDWEASEPPGPVTDTGTGSPSASYDSTTTDSRPDQYSVDVVATIPCQDHTYTAQLRKGQNGYDVSYTIAPCEDMVSFKVVLRSQTAPPYFLDSGYATKGNPYIQSMYDRICINVERVEYCFPAAE
jgi:hypothetical protein